MASARGLWSLALVACFACSDAGSERKERADASTPTDDAGSSQEGKIKIAGVVRDAQTSAGLEKATLTSAGEASESDAQGAYELTTRDTESMLSAGRMSYAETFRDVPPTGGSLDVYLKSVDQRLTFRGDAGVTITLPSGVRLEIPANAVVDGQGGRVSGEIELQLAVIDGSSVTQAAALPGRGMAQNKDQSTGLLSIDDALSINIRDAEGKKLSVDPTADVVAEVPVRGASGGAEIGVYSFDPKQKRWLEEGSAPRSALGGRDVYRADIEHLSWWSLGRFFDTVTCLRACVEDAQGKAVAGAQVWVVGASQSGVTTFFTDRTGCGAVDTIANADVVLVAQSGELASKSKKVKVGALRASAAKSPSQCQDAGVLTLLSTAAPDCPLCEALPPPADMDGGIELDDAGSALDAASPDAGGPVVDCTSSGPHRYYAAGQASDPVTLRGKTSELTLTPASTSPGIGFVARFEPDTCFAWAVRVTQGGIPRFALDPLDGSLYVVATSLAAGASLVSADGTVGATFDTNANEAVNRSGNEAVLAKFDSAGQMKWAKRFGQTGTAGSARFSVQELIFTGADVRVVGFVNRTNSTASHDFIFGPGETDQEVVSVRDNQIWSYAARFDPATGDYIAGSLDTFAAQGTANRGARFDGRGNGQPNASGTFAYGVWPSSTTTNPYTLTLNGTANNLSVGPGAEMMLLDSTRSLIFRRSPSVDSSPRNVAVLANDDSIWTGSVTLAALAPVSFPTSTTPQNLTLGTQDEFLVRYTAAGDIAWLKGVIADAGISFGFSGMIVAEDQDAAFFYGVANGSGNISFGQGEPGALSYSVPYSKSNFLARYKLSTGAFEWIRSVQVPGNYVFVEMSRLGNELIVTARVDGGVTFDPGGANQTFVEGARLGGAARYAFDGSFIAFAKLADFGSNLGGISRVLAVIP